MHVGGFDMFVMDLHFAKTSIAQLTHTSFFEVGGSNIHAPTYTKKSYESAFGSWKFVDLVKFTCSSIHISFLKMIVKYIGEKLLLCLLYYFLKCVRFEYLQAQNGGFRISRAIMHS